MKFFGESYCAVCWVLYIFLQAPLFLDQGIKVSECWAWLEKKIKLVAALVGLQRSY